MIDIEDQVKRIFISPSLPLTLDEQSDTDKQSEIEELTKQGGHGLKILTPEQMLILLDLPISLAQLRAGNNSEKLKMK